ncbi:MAG: mucoidy inhibitor MuiA family protein [Verrucomicrobiota bacterium]
MKTMSHLRLAVLSLSVLQSFSLSAATPVAATISAATVYADRAVVTRSARLEVPAGANELAFENLPAGLVTSSLQVTGHGPANAIILDVSAHPVRSETTADPGEKAIEDRIKALQDQDRVLADKAALLARQRALLAQIEAGATRPPPTGKDAAPTAPPPSFDDWQKLLDFSSDKARGLADAQRQIDDARRTLYNQLAAQGSALRDLNGQRPPARSTMTVTVRLTATAAGALDLALSYAVPGAGWASVYDARLRSDKRELELSYFGLVRNSTGEDWKDIVLTLSTARPALGGGVSEPAPWTLDLSQPSAVGVSTSANAPALVKNGTGSISAILGGSSQGANGNRASPSIIGGTVVYGTALNFSNAGAVQLGGPGGFGGSGRGGGAGGFAGNTTVPATGATLAVNANQTLSGGEDLVINGGQLTLSRATRNETLGRLDLAYQDAGLATGATSATFRIPNPASLPSDNAPQRIAITSVRLPALLQYQGVPSTSESVYLTTYATNGSDFPLLAGTLNAFLDDNFVATSGFGTVMPAARLNLSLGADEGISLKRRVVPRFAEDTGFTGKYRRVTYEFAYSITNHKPTAEHVMFKDVLPISRDERIVVKLIEPAERDLLKPEDLATPGALPKPGITREEDGKLVWRLDVKPGEKVERKLKFTVEYPADLPVAGLQ